MREENYQEFIQRKYRDAVEEYFYQNYLYEDFLQEKFSDEIEDCRKEVPELDSADLARMFSNQHDEKNRVSCHLYYIEAVETKIGNAILADSVYRYAVPDDEVL